MIRSPKNTPCKKIIVPAARWYALLLAMALAVLLASCSSSPPKNPNNACRIFKQNSSWHKHTQRAVKKWKVDAAVLLAIMRQESGFESDAKPRRNRFLGIPLRRPSSAFGYAQALDSTWSLYEKQTNRRWAQRDRFKHAIDFIGWYVAQSRRQLKISVRDGYRNYLAYHEGWKGYRQRTYKRKKWLLPVAKRVAKQAKRYRAQLASCRL